MSVPERRSAFTVPGAHSDGSREARVRGAPHAAGHLSPPGDAVPREGVEQPDAVAPRGRRGGEAAARSEEEARVPAGRGGGGGGGGGHEEQRVQGRPRGHHGGPRLGSWRPCLLVKRGGAGARAHGVEREQRRGQGGRGLGDEAKKRGAEPRIFGWGGRGLGFWTSAGRRACDVPVPGGCLTGGPQRL